MTVKGFEGTSLLLSLMGQRFKARLREFKRALKQPRKVAGLLVILLLVGGFLALQFVGGGQKSSQWERREVLASVLALFMLVTGLFTALATGVLHFSPAEVQILFPAPVGTRALILAGSLMAMAKSATGAVIFALLFRPEGTSTLRALLAWLLWFVLMVLVSVRVDLACMHLPKAVRKRRALVLGLLLAGGMLLLVGAGFRIRGHMSLALLEPLLLPAKPFQDLLGGGGPAHVMRGLLILLSCMALLWLSVLSFKGNIREPAGQTSARVQKRMERFSKGAVFMDAPTRATSGRMVPMLPWWGGAGVHIWRQFSVLLRQRRAYVGLMIFCGIVGVSASMGEGGVPGEPAAGTMLAMLAFAGPFYVQCDFRSDFDNLAWLRSLPSSPMALAAGQMLASALVLYGMQLLFGGWVFFVAPWEHLPLWLGIFLVLPLLNLLQLAVENGVFLLHPIRMRSRGGPPGMLEMGRIYLLMLVKFVVLGIALGLVAVPAGLAWELVNPLVGGGIALCLLLLEVALLIWLVGRIFVRVDPSRQH